MFTADDNVPPVIYPYCDGRDEKKKKIHEGLLERNARC